MGKCLLISLDHSAAGGGHKVEPELIILWFHHSSPTRIAWINGSAASGAPVDLDSLWLDWLLSVIANMRTLVWIIHMLYSRPG